MVHIFIINSQVVEKKIGDQLREHLDKRGDINYYIFTTSHAGMERELAQKMIRIFDGEMIRFYCCGGSGTLRNVADGTGNYKKVELAFYPCGSTNDLLKVYGEKASLFSDIDNLIDGETDCIDYIKTNYGIALNTVSFGLDSALSTALNNALEFDIFGDKIPFLVAYIKALLHAKPRTLKITADSRKLTEEVSEIIIGNGLALGGGLWFDEKADVKDGLFKYLIAYEKRSIGIMRFMMLMVKKKHDEINKKAINGYASYFEITTDDGEDISFNLDGEIVEGGNRWTIESVKQGLKFVVPKGVK